MIKLEGMEELQRKLEQLGKHGEKIRDQAVEAGGELLVAKVKDHVPKRTGKLQESITKTKTNKGTVEVGPNDDGYYGRFLEFGFYNKRVNRRISPMPFMAPAFERSKREIEQKMASEVKKGLGL